MRKFRKKFWPVYEHQTATDKERAMSESVRILGIDPGSRVTGFGLSRFDGLVNILGNTPKTKPLGRANRWVLGEKGAVRHDIGSGPGSPRRDLGDEVGDIHSGGRARKLPTRARRAQTGFAAITLTCPFRANIRATVKIDHPMDRRVLVLTPRTVSDLAIASFVDRARRDRL